MLKYKNIFLIGFLLLFVICCGGLFEPDPNGNDPIEIEVEVRYERKDDISTCSRTYFDPDTSGRVFLNGFILQDGKMEKLTDNVFFVKVSSVRVDYPYVVFVFDYAFATTFDSDTHHRAHDLYLNGYLITKIYRKECGESIKVKFDKNGIPEQL